MDKYGDNLSDFNKRTVEILEMIAIGTSTSKIYEAIALLYESKYPGLRCSMLELENGVLLHGGAPSLPKAYCECVNGIKYGPNIGSCGTSTYTGRRCIVEDIATDPKWSNLKSYALPYGLRSCWSEPIKDSKGKILGAFGMYHDYPATPTDEESKDLLSAARLAGLVMERDHNQKKIRELAFVDSLTKLSSRSYFYQYMESLIKSSKRLGREFSLLFLDLDDFKSINDTQGHDAGDCFLNEVAKRLNELCSDIDFIARLGGDEFCIVTEYNQKEDHTEPLAQRCLKKLSEPLTIDAIEHKISCSIGIARYPRDGKTIASILKAADTALYSAKEDNKNCYKFYHSALSKKVEYRRTMEAALRHALSKNEFKITYQPKIDIFTNRVIGVEALSRWHNEALGNVPPSEFITAAERIGIMNHFTEWVLYEACAQAAEWKKSNHLPLAMAVNVSPSSLLNNDIVQIVKQVINDTGISPELLELEVTENIFQLNMNNLAVFKKLKDLGVRLAIDDFGTGYASLASLKHISVDILKIDRYFIHDLLNNSNTKYLISSIIDIGKNCGYDIVAEGVEQKEQLDMLKQMNCTIIQGFYFSKPLPPMRAMEWMSRFSH